MATVLLVRHGRTPANSSGILAGRAKGTQLDEHGLEQAFQLGRSLTGLKPTALISSPLERTMQTAEIIAGEISVELPEPITVVEDSSFIECDYGDWTGRSLDELAQEPLWRAVQDHPSSVKFPGVDGESMAAMQARAVAGIRHWNDLLGPDSIYMVVSHGDVIKAVIADSLGVHLDNFQRIVVDPCSVSVIRYSELRPFVISVNGDGRKVDRIMTEAKRTESDAAVGGGSS